jgi:predicted RNA-binding Zn ribbon-like protein
MSFTFLGGRPSLDFLATERFRHQDGSEELLGSPADFERWCQESGLVDHAVTATSTDLEHAKRLRAAGVDVIDSLVTDGTSTERSVSDLNAAAEGQPVTFRLGADLRLVRAGTASQVLATVARDLLDLVGSESRVAVRQCDGPECTRYFLDSSRSRTRRFCSDALCGNRAKVAAFRQRARQRHVDS